MYTPTPDAVSMAKVQAIWDWYFAHVEGNNHQDQHDYRLMKALQLVDARPHGRSVWKLAITRNLCNSNGHLHGGAAATVFDMCTMSALGPLHRPDGWYFLGGLSRSMNVSYIRACPIGTEVLIDSEVIQAGRNMAMIRGVMKSLDEKLIYATVEHHKINIGKIPEHMMKYEVKPKI